MKDVEDLITPLVKQQFPGFYATEGVDFIEFTKAYYAWMESAEGPIYHARRLPDYRDVDNTIDEFVVHFKEKYLADFPLDETSTDNRFLIKHIMDFYRAKGSERGLKIFMRSKYGDVVDVYYPGRDVFRLSAGKWVQPKYLELLDSPRLIDLVGQEIVGSSTGARAFVENVTRRRVAGKYVNVAFISNVRGDFIFGEYVSNDGVIADAPRIVGSLTTLDILDGGQDYAVGDILTVVSTDGKDAKVRVTGISTETGVVRFTLADGGWGYSMNAQVLISTKVLGITNTQPFYQFFNAVQPLETVTFISANADFVVGDVIDNYYTNGVHYANGVVLQVDQPTGASNGSMVIAPYKAPFVSAANVILYNSGNTKTSQIATATTTTATGNVIGSNSGFVGVISVNNSFFTANNNRIYSESRTGIAKINVIAGGSGYTNGDMVSVSGGAGTGANAYVTTNATGGIVSVVMGDEGTNYKWLADTANVFITTGGGTSATLNAVPWAFNQQVGEVSLGSDASFDIGSLTWTEAVRVGVDFINTNNYYGVAWSTVSLNGNNANSGQVATVYIADGGTAYQNTDTVTFTGGGGSAAAATLSTNATGGIISVTMTNHGTGYTSIPAVGVTTGTGSAAVLQARMGLGFTKSPTSGFDETLFNSLTFQDKTIGTIASITNFNRGTGYNRSPFVVVYERAIAALDRRDVKLTLSNIAGGSFTPGDLIYQSNTSTAVIELTVKDAIQTPYDVGEIVWQWDGAANAYGILEAATIVGANGVLTVSGVTGTFDNNYMVIGATSNAQANVVSSAANNLIRTAKGIVKEFDVANNTLWLQRITLVPDFLTTETILDVDSGATADIDTVENDVPPQVGLDAVVSANVQTANAVVSTVQVIDSGIGYVSNSTITLIGANNASVVTARTNVTNQGISEGYYRDTASFLSNDKRLHDGEYYQDFSYEIRSGISIDTYGELLKKVAHVAGTKFFGRFVNKTELDAAPATYQHTYELLTEQSVINVTGAMTVGESANSGANSGIVVGFVANTTLVTSSGNTALPSWPEKLLLQSANVSLITTDVTGTFITGDVVAIANGFIAANIVSSNTSSMVVQGANGVFMAGDVVYGTYVGEFGYTLASGTAFANGETITLGANTAKVVGVTSSTLQVANVVGTFAVGQTIVGAAATGTLVHVDTSRPSLRVVATNNSVVGLGVSYDGANIALTGADLSIAMTGKTLVADRSREKFVVSSQAGNTAVVILSDTVGNIPVNSTITGNTSGTTANVQSVAIQVR